MRYLIGGGRRYRSCKNELTELVSLVNLETHSVPNRGNNLPLIYKLGSIPLQKTPWRRFGKHHVLLPG